MVLKIVLVFLKNYYPILGYIFYVFKWKECQDIILETFDKDRIVYSEHSTPGGKHTPL
jgi:hypothetical protein